MAEANPATREKLDAQIKAADMNDDLAMEIIDVAQEAMSRLTIEKDIAEHVKKTFDERKGPTWHCIVGRNFGSFVTHESKHFLYFYLGHCAFLVFKTQ
ncbi:hypothetical protein MCOR27_011175 [Pyricularia oryzae]|uniref:Dynein light chain n=4 Tax=Pyricularia TaxID=48558 RepID=G4MX14_PYRO7|nr:hypothetical protein, variant 2 [Pyricularia oryzae 70-15]XP_003714114.1 hypothetical protein, variant 1 [Pyricularia oryzae 70-15]XP_030984961.1 uncharacterized protein PgNI_04342 [Pyricularia grisea]KAH8836985.1 hypothetical protein MCOR01_010629 [Pyricularia oryzae]TLD27067.1 hypothetical protein PspLS_04414 [Pyricularia sp. CBS 133598]EHA54306.1 hypothetical protein, variant 2 [Pyricularia oryzae 70-15]EHA54307.1 hypothetical protein, variant 1 [Pyricularia oryzae 70-15]KAH9438361.1 h